MSARVAAVLRYCLFMCVLVVKGRKKVLLQRRDCCSLHAGKQTFMIHMKQRDGFTVKAAERGWN